MGLIIVLLYNTNAHLTHTRIVSVFDLTYYVLKVMCFLEHHQVEFIMLAFLKGGLESTGGVDEPLFFLSQLFLSFLH